MAEDSPPSSPNPFFLEGGSTGCLLIHGFTGSPADMRLLGRYLHDHGLTVSAPLLAGHGTQPDDLNRTCWRDWVESAAAEFSTLRERCDAVFAAGISMGALVAAHLAVQQEGIAGLILYSPALRIANRLTFLIPVLKHFIKHWPKSDRSDLTDPRAERYVWSYDTFPLAGAHELLKFQRVVRRDLGEIDAPCIIFHSTGDEMIASGSAQSMFERLGSPRKELVTLHNSGHVLVVDAERQTVFARTLGFITAHSSG